MKIPPVFVDVIFVVVAIDVAPESVAYSYNISKYNNVITTISISNYNTNNHCSYFQ